ncbi:alpha/beta fold hydrolase [Dactylosporangium sp. CS-033363]|uniref:alpha/beta fold hydrolase n=1 Tax=Dactylosporangium sp. CS-033363 TaxID=3239935 RepID=UPI003D92ED37
MSTFVLIHAAGESSWTWHLVAPILREHGHEVVAPDLPADDDRADLDDYTETAVKAVGAQRDTVVVGHSFGAFTAPLVADRLGARLLVLTAGMVPAPGEKPADWWDNVGYRDFVPEEPDDPYFHDVPRPLAEEAQRRERAHPSTAAYGQPWPLPRWPAVQTRFVLGTEDRCFPPALFRKLVPERLGIQPDEIESGHCMSLAHPMELATTLIRITS